MEPLVFRNHCLLLARLRAPLFPLRAESVAGFVGAPSAPSAPSVVSVPSCAVLRRLAPSCAVLRRLAPSCAVCAVLRDGEDGEDGERSETTALCDRNVSFQPARNIPSLRW